MTEDRHPEHQQMRHTGLLASSGCVRSWGITNHRSYQVLCDRRMTQEASYPAANLAPTKPLIPLVSTNPAVDERELMRSATPPRDRLACGPREAARAVQRAVFGRCFKQGGFTCDPKGSKGRTASRQALGSHEEDHSTASEDHSTNGNAAKRLSQTISRAMLRPRSYTKAVKQAQSQKPSAACGLPAAYMRAPRHFTSSARAKCTTPPRHAPSRHRWLDVRSSAQQWQQTACAHTLTCL